MTMMYEIDPAATSSSSASLSSAAAAAAAAFPLAFCGGGSDEPRDDHRRRRCPERRRSHRDGSSEDDIGIVPPAWLRRFFFAAFGAAFLWVVVLLLVPSSTTRSVVVDPARRPLRLSSSSSRSSNSTATTTYTGPEWNDGAPVPPDTIRRQTVDESTTSTSSSSTSFASSIVSLVQQSVDQTVQIVGDADNRGDEGSSSVAGTGTASPTTAPDASGIREGTVNGVAYYSCRATSSSAEKTILLFHGSSFSKENWKESGILGSLCAQPTLTTYAFDLSVSSTADDLTALMDALLQSNLIGSLPVSAIVTPSASGAMVGDWGLRTAANVSSFAPMIDYWKLWVPVASAGVANVDPKSLLSSMYPHIQILAVHGDQDTSGGRVMGLLKTYAGAKVVTIPGGHPCYLQSPDAFVQAVLAEIL
jgi:pimeloyl-ACP methyl ester carboxylesterase